MVDISSYIEKLENAVYGEEVRGALVDLAVNFNNRIGDGLVFVAEYGVTTHAEIVEATNSGKIVIAIRNKLLYLLCQAPSSGGTKAAFSRVTSGGYQTTVISCSSSNTWSSSTTTLATQSWVTNKVNNAINDAITAAIEGSY